MLCFWEHQEVFYSLCVYSFGCRRPSFLGIGQGSPKSDCVPMLLEEKGRIRLYCTIAAHLTDPFIHVFPHQLFLAVVLLVLLSCFYLYWQHLLQLSLSGSQELLTGIVINVSGLGSRSHFRAPPYSVGKGFPVYVTP